MDEAPKLKYEFRHRAPGVETQLAGVCLLEGRAAQPAAFGILAHDKKVREDTLSSRTLATRIQYYLNSLVGSEVKTTQVSVLMNPAILLRSRIPSSCRHALLSRAWGTEKFLGWT